MKLAQENLNGKLILEVGSGRGDTTRQLARLAKGYPDTKLVATDISDTFFPDLQIEFQKEGLTAQFVQTDACQLQGIEPETVDYLVCNYTLCAVNAQETAAVLALRRFYEVLRSGGWLLVEEEFPLRNAANPRQEVWSEKWRILKAAALLSGRLPYTELSPEALAVLCQALGFREVRWTQDTTFYPGVESLDFFHRRLEGLMLLFPDEAMRAGFTRLADRLREAATLAGGMEIPFYRLEARKPG